MNTKLKMLYDHLAEMIQQLESVEQLSEMKLYLSYLSSQIREQESYLDNFGLINDIDEVLKESEGQIILASKKRWQEKLEKYGEK